MRRTSVFALGVMGLFALAGQALGAVDVIYCKKAGHAKAQVPGAMNAGGPVATEWRSMLDLVVSRDGTKWVIRGANQLDAGATANYDNMMVTGSGTTGQMLAQEGQPIVGGAAGEVYDFFSSVAGKFNDTNHFAYGARARGGVASVFQKIIRYDGSSTAILHQMGDLISGLVDTGTAGDETFGNSVGVGHFLNSGVAALHDTTVGNISSTRRPVLTYGSVGFMQANVATALDLAGTSTVTLAGFSNQSKANTFAGSPDAAPWSILATQVGQPTTSDAVLVVTGRVRVQEGNPVPSDTATVDGIFAHGILANHDWIARGSILGGGAWAVRNGTLLAKTGGVIAGAETWGATFYALAANNAGDWAMTAKTSSADPAADEVLVLNGTQVLLREGDPIDLDGNGSMDDDAFVGRGNNTLVAFDANNLAIADDGTIWTIINLRDAAGNDLASSPAFGVPSAFVRITPGAPPCPADLDDGSGTGVPDGGVDINDLLYFLAQYEAGNIAADLDDGSGTGTPDGGVDINDLLFFLSHYEAGC